MASVKRVKSHKRKEWVYKTLFFIFTVILIVCFLPQDGKFNYKFDINQPWKYNELISTFNFPIYKEEAVIKREQDSLMTCFQPYFELDKQVQQNAETALLNVIPSQEHLQYLIPRLHKVYNAGILSSQDADMLLADSTKSIMVVSDKLAQSKEVSSLYSVQEAYRTLVTDSTPEILNAFREYELNDFITPNLIYDSTRTQTAKEELLSSYSWAQGMVIKGQKIIDRGEIITPQTYNILESWRKETLKRDETPEQNHLTFVGQIIFVCLIVLFFLSYLNLYRKDYFLQTNTLALLFVLIVAFNIITSIVVSRNVVNVYVIPYVMLPVVIKLFLDSRTAFITHVITILLCAIPLHFPYEFILTQLTAGLVAIQSLKELSQRSQLFRTMLFSILTYALTFFSLELMMNASLASDFTNLDFRMYIRFFINGILLLFTYPLLFLLEKLFGFTSNVTLVELSNINTPLLRQLSETTPGTFQHSMQVANLAAQAAVKVNAKSQLVRTGALYHDIGKMKQPVFFTENQSGSLNPHRDLSYEESARILISHICEGLKLAEKHNLPKVIKDFISTHHGNGKTKYFYISWKNEHPGMEPDEQLFTYPGPNPFTKEQAILMMADAVEAASRSINEYTEQNIALMVNKIIDAQVNEGYFKECPITFKDIAIIKEVFKEKLKTIYHTRISYPDLKG